MRLHVKQARLYAQVSLMILVLGLGLMAGMGLDHFWRTGTSNQDAAPDFRLVSQAWSLIDRFYVDRAGEHAPAMTYGAIRGMVSALGDTGHSRFLSPQMVKEMNELERSSFQGIGAEVQVRAGHAVIVAPLDGSPAQRAGLKAGDVILQVNGRDIAGEPLDQVVMEIGGRAGTRVTLTILTPASGYTRQVTLTRATIKIHNVTWQTLPDSRIVDLRIAAFESGVTKDLRQALMDIRRQSAAGLVLDLRNNPGGLLDQAIGVASQFVNGGNVVVVKNARGEEKPIRAKTGAEAASIPLVALVNGGTASGAEIVAGALQDAKRGPLVGDTTFGTGTVLSEFKLADGSALLLAVEEWLTPAGHVIWHRGITPNMPVALPAGASPVFPEALRDMDVKQLQASHDTQLLRALELLKNTR